MARLEELKKDNTLRRLRDKLVSLNSEFSNVEIKSLDRSLGELDHIADAHIVCNIDADGMMVENISDVYSLMKKEITKFIDTYGDQTIQIPIPFGDYFYEAKMSLNLVLNMFDVLITNFFQCDEHCTEEISIYTDNFDSGICLWRDEYHYFISVWNR